MKLSTIIIIIAVVAIVIFIGTKLLVALHKGLEDIFNEVENEEPIDENK